MTPLKSTGIALLVIAMSAIALSRNITADEFTRTIDRSPADLVLSQDEAYILTANQTSHSVSLVRVSDGAIIDEAVVGQRPICIIVHPHRDEAFVSCQDSGEIHRLLFSENGLKPNGVIVAGSQPHGLAMTSDGETAYVALTDTDSVAEIDVNSNQVRETIGVGRWPRFLSLSGDGKRMAVGTSGDRGISIVDTQTRSLIKIDRFVGLNIGHMALSLDGSTVYFPWMVYRRNPITSQNIKLGWVMASRLGRIDLAGESRREAISLDPPGIAIADPYGIALTPDESKLALSASGTQEILLLQVKGLPFRDRGSTDHIDEELLNDSQRFQRIALGGRPMGIRFSKEGRMLYVANYLDNSVQVVDIHTSALVRRIPLGPVIEPSTVRRGEAIFHDARRSLDQWYSCHSCHYDGGTNSVTMDTFNDGTANTFKTVLPLYELEGSGPWTWHGWQNGFYDAMEHSLRTTMLGPPAKSEDVEALMAYLSQLKPPQDSRSNLSAAQEGPGEDEKDSVSRGREIFLGEKGNCASCHVPPSYFDGLNHDLGVGSAADAHVGFNTPSLKGVFRKVLFMHDGRASSLEELLTDHHAPDKVAGEALSDDEVADLVAFLKTL